MKRVILERLICEQAGLSQLRRPDIEKLQLQRLNDVLRRQRERQAFYVDLPPSLSSLSGLAGLPFTTPAQLAERGHAMVLLSQSAVSRVITEQTSGTTGPAKRVYYTQGDCKRTVDFFAAGLAELIGPGERTVIAMPFSGPNGLGDLIAQAIERLGAEPIRAGLGLTFGEYAALLGDDGVHTFVGLPVQLLSILRAGGGRQLRRALVSGDVCSPAVQAAIEAYGITLFPHYGSREIGLGGAVTCQAQAGMHVRENHVIVEIIGPDGAVLPPGQWGELVVTTIGMEAMPLIRYRTGDWTRILPGICPCGSELLRLDRVSRADRCLEELDEVLFPLQHLVDYKLRLSADAVEVAALVTTDMRTALSNRLQQLFPDRILHLSQKICSPEDRCLYARKRSLYFTL